MKKITEKLSRVKGYVWIIAAVLIAVAETVRRYVFGGTCILKDLTGIPCPACGMSRAYLSLLMLDFRAAMHYNPAFWTFPVAVLTCVLAFADRKHRKLWISLFSLMVIILLSVWIVRLATGTAV